MVSIGRQRCRSGPEEQEEVIQDLNAVTEGKSKDETAKEL